MKIVTVLGARPQFVKASVVSRALARAGGFVEVLVHTGQHFDRNMSDVFFEDLRIPAPNYNLGIGGGPHGQNTGRMIEAIESLLLAERPDWVLVYGDTDSTLAGALAAVKLAIPVAHVEAGLRSFNRAMPEEINRILTDGCSDLLMAPSDAAVANLAREGVAGSKVHLVGDVMYDAALFFDAMAKERGSLLDTLGLRERGYVLCTLHRQENVDDRGRLRGILAGIAASPMPVVLPLHPRTRARIAEFGFEMPANVQAIDPVGYIEMIQLERSASLIMTDSGGVQKEAFFHRVPCITLREETEWVELVEAGVNRLAGADPVAIQALLGQRCDPAGFDVELYGGGRAGERIVETLGALVR